MEIEILQTFAATRDEVAGPLLLTAKDAIEDRVLGSHCGSRRLPGQTIRVSRNLGLAISSSFFRTEQGGFRERAQDWRSGNRSPCDEQSFGKEHRIELTPREFDLLEYLARNHGRVVSSRNACFAMCGRRPQEPRRWTTSSTSIIARFAKGKLIIFLHYWGSRLDGYKTGNRVQSRPG